MGREIGMKPTQQWLEARAADLDQHQTFYERQFWRSLEVWAEKHDVVCATQIAMCGCIVDFFFPQIQLVVELDGRQHNPAKDAARDERLLAQGLRVLRFPNPLNRQEMFAILEMVRGEFKDYLAARHWEKLRMSDRSARRKALRPHREI